MELNDKELLRLLKHGRAEELAELAEEMKPTYADSFPAFMDQMLKEHHLKRSTVARRSGLSQDYLYKLLRGVQYLVPVGGEAFSGLVRSNAAAAFILDCLREDITEEQLVDKMCRKYNAPREVIAADTAQCLNTLREIHALEESE